MNMTSRDKNDKKAHHDHVNLSCAVIQFKPQPSYRTTVLKTNSFKDTKILPFPPETTPLERSCHLVKLVLSENSSGRAFVFAGLERRHLR